MAVRRQRSTERKPARLLPAPALRSRALRPQALRSRALLTATLAGLGLLLAAGPGCEPPPPPPPPAPHAHVATSAAPAAPAASAVQAAALPARALEGPFRPEAGKAWFAELPVELPEGDSGSRPGASALRLLEDGRELGPAHATHDAIRTLGAGRYSHWGRALWFSTSDGSDPRTNGRRYAVAFRPATTDGAAGDDEAGIAARIAAELAAAVDTEAAADPATRDGSHATLDGSPAARKGSHAALVQAALDFVHRNSEHRIDEQHDREAFDTPRMLRAMREVHTGASSARPPLSCGPRACAMQALLAELGIASRLVQVFSTRGGQVGAHRFLEVLEPRSQRWEAWDPDHDVCYVDARSGERVGADRLVLAGPQQVVPRRGDVTGWEPLGLAWLGGHDFAAVAFEPTDRAAGTSDPVILHDPRRFDPDRRLADGGSFREWAQRMLGTCRYVPVAEPR